MATITKRDWLGWPGGRRVRAKRFRALASGELVAALNAPIVQFGVRDFGFAVSLLTRASAARRFRLQPKFRRAGNCGAVGNRSGNRAY
jgi:hypothetical protein